MTTEVVETADIPGYSFAQVVASIAVVEPDVDELPGTSLVETICACEQIIRAAEALQAHTSTRLLAEREAAMPGRQAFLSTAGESALARGMSPAAGITQLENGITMARMPAIGAAWANGLISSATVRAIVKNLPPLANDEIALIEAELEPHLPGLTPRTAAELVRSLVIEIDPDEADRKAQSTRDDQYVIITDEPDGVSTLIAHGPTENIHHIGHTLTAAARHTTHDPDDHRTRGQAMFTALTTAITSTSTSTTGPTPPRVLELGIVLSADTLFGASDIPAQLTGHGPIAPALLDHLIDEADQIFYRRLITDPLDDTLRHIDPTRRLFTGTLARHIRYRDHHCRGPACDAPITEIDHITAHHHGGETTLTNGQGLCTLTHHIKHTPGWTITPHHNGTTTWTTPTGHTYTTPPPPLTRRRQ